MQTYVLYCKGFLPVMTSKHILNVIDNRFVVYYKKTDDEVLAQIVEDDYYMCTVSAFGSNKEHLFASIIDAYDMFQELLWKNPKDLIEYKMLDWSLNVIDYKWYKKINGTCVRKHDREFFKKQQQTPPLHPFSEFIVSDCDQNADCSK